MWPNRQFPADLVTSTAMENILFLCSTWSCEPWENKNFWENKNLSAEFAKSLDYNIKIDKY